MNTFMNYTKLTESPLLWLQFTLKYLLLKIRGKTASFRADGHARLAYDSYLVQYIKSIFSNTFIPIFMKTRLLIFITFLSLLSVTHSFGQACVGPIPNTWFQIASGGRYMMGVSVSQDGSKAAVLASYGNDEAVRMGSTGTDYGINIVDAQTWANIPSLSKSPSFVDNAWWGLNVVWTKEGGYIFSQNGNPVKYVKPDGSAVTTTQQGYNNTTAPEASRKYNYVFLMTQQTTAPLIKLQKYDATTNTYTVLDSADPTYSLTGTSGGANLKFPIGIDDSLERVYYIKQRNKKTPCDICTVLGNTVTTTNEYAELACKQYDGSPCVGFNGKGPGNSSLIWNADGQESIFVDVAVRPTDGKIFVSYKRRPSFDDMVNQFSGHTRNPSDVIVFNTDGSVDSTYDYTYHSMVSNYNGQSFNIKKLRFDKAGNLFMITGTEMGNNSNWVGDTNYPFQSITKFNPEGVLDMNFAYNFQKNYVPLKPEQLFLDIDIFPSGEIIGVGRDRLEPIKTENWDIQPLRVDLPLEYKNWVSVVLSPTTVPYSYVNLIHNNGVLMRPNESSTSLTSNCGISTFSMAATKNSNPSGPMTATIDCNATEIIGNVVVGTPAELSLKVVINVTTAGLSAFDISGSGLSAKTTGYTISTNATGPQVVYIPILYDGSAMGSMTFSLAGIGSCTADLSTLSPTNKTTVNHVISLGNACTPITPTVLSK